VYTGIVWALVGSQPVPVSNTGAVSARPALRGTPLPTLAPVALSALEPPLNALWNALDKGDKKIIWQPAHSPFFPSEWPPTPTTTWVRYAFAYGLDPDIGGGQRVAPPWAFVEVRAGGEMASIAQQRLRLEAFDVQGTVSLSREALAALNKGEQVVVYSLSLSAVPAASSSEGADMRAFYRAWFAGNGAIAALIKPAHAGFVAWVEP
jgi:hypothetical protein